MLQTLKHHNLFLFILFIIALIVLITLCGILFLARTEQSPEPIPENPTEVLQKNEILQLFYDEQKSEAYKNIFNGMCMSVFSETSARLTADFYAHTFVEFNKNNTKWGTGEYFSGWDQFGYREKWGYPNNPSTEEAWDIIKDHIREDIMTMCRRSTEEAAL